MPWMWGGGLSPTRMAAMREVNRQLPLGPLCGKRASARLERARRRLSRRLLAER